MKSNNLCLVSLSLKTEPRVIIYSHGQSYSPNGLAPIVASSHPSPKALLPEYHQSRGTEGINDLSSLATSPKGGFFLYRWQTSGTLPNDTEDSITPITEENHFSDYKHPQHLLYFIFKCNNVRMEI